jgi:hypothetical protein
LGKAEKDRKDGKATLWSCVSSISFYNKGKESPRQTPESVSSN